MNIITSDFEDLVSFRPPEAIQKEILDRGCKPASQPWRVQKIEEANGALNLDRYLIFIETPPTIDGRKLTAKEFQEHVRKHFGELLDPRMVSFHGYDSEEQKRWESTNPLGAVMQFDISLAPGGPVARKACVVLSEITGEHWIFSTLHAGDDGIQGHPVSGNRRFGVVDNEPLEGYYFVTRAADRLTEACDRETEEQTFARAHALWLSLMSRIGEFVTANGGKARTNVRAPQSERVSWEEVKSQYHKPSTGWIGGAPGR